MMAELSSTDSSMSELSCSVDKGVCTSFSESASILGALENRGNTTATCSWNCLFTAEEREEVDNRLPGASCKKCTQIAQS